MKALLYIPSLGHGGPDRVFFELATNLYKFGIDVEILTQIAGGRYWDRLPDNIVKTALFSSVDVQLEKAYSVKMFADYVNKSQPDVVMCTLRSLTTAVLAKLMGKIKVPLVIRPANHITRNSLELLKQSPFKHSLSWLLNIASLHIASHVICQSDDLFDDFRRYGVPQKRLTIIGNPIQLPQEIQLQEWRQHRVHGKPLLVAVGRLMPQKGFDILIKAVSLVKATLPELHVVIFGEGQDRQLLDQLIQANQLGGMVELAGFSSQVPQYIASADFLVSSSRYEGFPNVVLESLAYGVPVIATNCPGGTRELVIDGKTGWLCTPDSESALAEAILKACAVPKPAYDEIRQFVEETYSIDIVVQRYANVLKTVVAGR